MGFVSDVAAVFAVAVLRDLGSNPAAVWGFRKRSSKVRSLLEAIFSCLFLLSGFCKRRCGSFCGCGFAWLGFESCCCLRLSEAVFQGQISRLRFSLLEAIFSCLFVFWVFFWVGFVCDVAAVFAVCGFAWLGLESCCCLRLSEAVFQGQISRLRFSLLEAIFSCLFLLSGFCKRRCGSFFGCGFAWLGLESCCCLRLSEAVFQGQISRRRFSWLEAIFSWFCVTWARILLLFEAFGSGLPRSDFETKVFFAGGIRFLSLSFEWFCKRRFGTFGGCGFAWLGLESCWLGLESCCCLRLSEAVFQGQISRLRFSLLESIFSCLFLLSGFCKRRCGSFCGCGFAWLGLESCCCLRLSEAVFQGQISRLRFPLLEAIFSCLFLCFFWVGFICDVSAVFAVAVLRDLGSNPPAVWGFRKRSSKVRFRD